jgi:hypothetical protein
MKFQIVFDKTGDQIDLVSVNSEVLEYYVHQLNQSGLNCFSLEGTDWVKETSQLVDQLHSSIVDTNCWISELVDSTFDTFNAEDYFSQYNLNKLHADWVNYQKIIYNIDAKRHQNNFSGVVEQIHDMFPDSERFVPVAILLSKLEKDQQYDKINLLIHKLENKFSKIHFETADHKRLEFPNIFDKSILTNNYANFCLRFRHRGRLLYDKFRWFDVDLEHEDENSFDELLGYVSLQLLPCQTIPLSTEYLQWCARHNRIPSGEHLNIGNIPDLQDRMTHYRKLIFKNLSNENNFSIYLN